MNRTRCWRRRSQRGRRLRFGRMCRTTWWHIHTQWRLMIRRLLLVMWGEWRSLPTLEQSQDMKTLTSPCSVMRTQMPALSCRQNIWLLAQHCKFSNFNAVFLSFTHVLAFLDCWLLFWLLHKKMRTTLLWSLFSYALQIVTLYFFACSIAVIGLGGPWPWPSWPSDMISFLLWSFFSFSHKWNWIESENMVNNKNNACL